MPRELAAVGVLESGRDQTRVNRGTHEFACDCLSRASLAVRPSHWTADTGQIWLPVRLKDAEYVLELQISATSQFTKS